VFGVEAIIDQWGTSLLVLEQWNIHRLEVGISNERVSMDGDELTDSQRRGTDTRHNTGCAAVPERIMYDTMLGMDGLVLLGDGRVSFDEQLLRDWWWEDRHRRGGRGVDHHGLGTVVGHVEKNMKDDMIRRCCTIGYILYKVDDRQRSERQKSW